MEALNLKWLSAMVPFSIAAQAKATEPAFFRPPMTGPAGAEGFGRTGFFRLLIVRVEHFQRFHNLIVRDSFIRLRMKTKSWYGIDGEDVGRPRCKDGALFVMADVIGGKHVTRVTEMMRRMKQVRGAYGCFGAVVRSIGVDVLSHILAPKINRWFLG
ncbi:hypothetical protein ATY76_29125 [Rhizobium sp. R339]|nr:hypothetical protein ATY76_29125 [Rhizobium sp. R339]